MKKILVASLATLTLASCGNNYSDDSYDTDLSTPTTTASGATTTTASGSKISAEMVASHNTSSDCWAIIDGKVYDLTKWIAVHPGGKGPILRSCGKDVSNESASHPGGAFSNPKVLNILKKFYKGDLTK